MRKQIRKIAKAGLIVGVMLMSMGVFSACSKKEDLPEVNLSLWVDTQNSAVFEDALDAFADKYKEEVKFDFVVSVESEMSNKETVLEDPKGAADIFMFADDQLEEMWRAGALLEITDDAEKVIAAVGGKENGAAIAAMRDNKLYAYPLTAGNGYFLYYNKAYFSEEDIQNLDKILEVAATNKKKFAMDFTSGWYQFAFFKGAGLDLSCNEDGITNSCNWNATDTAYTGVDVVTSMLEIAKHNGFLSCQDSAFVEGVEAENIIAGVNGAWNAEAIQKAWGKNFGAAMLPKFSIKNDSVQMCSFSGYKMIGINAYTKEPEWAMKLAKYLSGEEMQMRRFEEIGECPANQKVWSMEKVQNSPVLAALKDQEPYGYVQNVADPFWNATTVLGTTIAAGNKENRDLQQLLDDAVRDITSSPKEESE